MHTNPATPYGPHRLPEILHRIAWPLLLFLVVLTGILLLSYWLLLPRWTHVQIAGDLLGPDEAEAYAAQLEEEVAVREASRMEMALPLRDETYAMLAEKRAAYLEPQELRDALTEAARRGSPDDAPDAVRIDAVTFDAGAKRVTVEGVVSGVGPRSMTVLAYFTETLHELPFVHAVTPPAFERVETAEGFQSPFAIVLTLQDASPSDR